MIRFIAAALLLAGCAPAPRDDGGAEASRKRLVILSLDGLSHELATRKMAEGKMPRLAELVSRGAHAADGSLTCYPAMTAPGHATLWTGRWADGHGVHANLTPSVPRRGHRLGELRSGFDAEALLAEPFWRTAALAGRSVTVVQATHAHPANQEELGLPTLRIFNHYHGLLEPAIVTRSPFEVGGVTFRVVPTPDGLDVSSGRRRWTVSRGAFCAVDHPDVPGVFYLWLARLDTDGFAVLRSSCAAVAAPSAADAARFRADVGGCAYDTLDVGEPLLDGTPWKRDAYVAGARLNMERVRDAVLWALRTHPADVTVAYLPQPDHALHNLLGRIELAKDRDAERLLDQILAQCDELVGAIADAAGPDGAVAIVSDHGFASVDTVFFPNLALERAGLLARSPSGGVDFAKSQVVFMPGDYLAVNTADRAGGIVPSDEKEAWLDLAWRAIEKAAESAVGPAALRPAMRPGGTAEYGLGAEGDLYVCAASDGVRLRAQLSAALPTKDAPLARAVAPAGHHSGDPSVPRMRAFVAFAGAGFRRADLKDVRHVDFAPTVLAWLGVAPAAGTTGRVLTEALEER